MFSQNRHSIRSVQNILEKLTQVKDKPFFLGDWSCLKKKKISNEEIESFEKFANPNGKRKSIIQLSTLKEAHVWYFNVSVKKCLLADHPCDQISFERATEAESCPRGHRDVPWGIKRIPIPEDHLPLFRTCVSIPDRSRRWGGNSD